MQSLKDAHKDIAILGCGNILFGDDGFGSYVAEFLQHSSRLPENVAVINAKTSVRGILFDLILSEPRPRKVIIIDAVDAKKKPGEIFKIPVDALPENKTDDFTFHQMPTSNLLRELRDFCHVDVILIAAQVQSIPEAVSPGLSEALIRSVPLAAEEVFKLCDEPRQFRTGSCLMNP